MTEYRFTLQKYKRGSKLTCPKCGRKSNVFVKYVDAEGQIAFPDYVGRCDHEHSCQYHYKPSDYFKDNSVVLEEGSHGSHKQKLCSPSQQITLTVTLCTARLPTTNGIRYSSFFQVYLVRKKHPGCSNYTVSGHPRNGEAPRCSGRLTDKEECEPERLCCIIR